MSDKKSIIRDTLRLTIITVVSGLLLGLVYEITLKPREAAAAKATNDAYKAVFEEAASFTPYKDFDADKAKALIEKAGYKDISISACVTAEDKSNKALGYVLTVVTKSYGGNVTFSMGVTNKGKMNGYKITDTSDTPGLGLKARDDPSFGNQFKGISAGKYSVIKGKASKNQIQAISGATITSRAITNGVNAGFEYYKSIAGGEK
ncbi:MAG: FMN-binding protein [Lachnospiraceae bacterium]|uniref:Ion-translocating oxidoreductase complex subunit G n=1 Tax=Candidatus Weimeria bifida TaxID=2599074 RepID=A0A6N7J0N4_9FIRM|nr:FMN-binding protein [Candidatus Weimeria bifida]RRF97019.1 MAG: FMN-binding protein [Lachnospiraceae bacterium]